jgi:regulator of replication initiation timing
MTIATLQKENSRLKDQVKKLVDENTAKDRVIDDLKRRVDELETKLSTVESAEKRRQDCE